MLLQCVRSLVKESLELAAKDGMSSVSFPAIGTGGLHFPHSTVSNIMFDEVINFSARSAGRQCSLKNVYFVVYQKDQAAVDVRHSIY